MPVWLTWSREVATTSLVARSACPRLGKCLLSNPSRARGLFVPWSLSLTGGRHDPTQAEESAPHDPRQAEECAPTVFRRATRDPTARCRHRCPCCHPLGGGVAGRCSSASRQPPRQPAGARAFLRCLH